MTKVWQTFNAQGKVFQYNKCEYSTIKTHPGMKNMVSRYKKIGTHIQYI